MKFKKIILIGGVAWLGYEVFAFFRDEANQKWLEEIESNTQNVINDYDLLKAKTEQLSRKNLELMQPAIKSLSRNLTDFTYIIKLKGNNLEQHLTKLAPKSNLH